MNNTTNKNGADGHPNNQYIWNSIFQLPKATHAGYTRIPKAELVRQASLTHKEARQLKPVRSLTHAFTVQKSTTHILPTINDNYNIQSVLFLHCEMQNSQAFAQTAKLIHKCFPHPTVIMFGGEKFAGDEWADRELAKGANDEWTDREPAKGAERTTSAEQAESLPYSNAAPACISVSLTRKSKHETGATVVEHIVHTGTFNPNNPQYATFLNSLAFSAMPQNSLLEYVRALSARVQLSRVINVLGYYPECNKQNQTELFNALNTLEELNSEIKEIDTRRRTDKELSINETSKLRLQLEKLEQMYEKTAQHIRKICD